jgi:drug/metabolite transporter superfamily protein YnfA
VRIATFATIALIIELPMLLIIWKWSARRKIYLALIGLAALILAPVFWGLVVEERLPTPAYWGFGGMYIFAVLVWRWWKDGVAPDNWNAGEVVLAMISTAMFSLASSSLS